jgi:hypothetical protein
MTTGVQTSLAMVFAMRRRLLVERRSRGLVVASRAQRAAIALIRVACPLK